jgi:NAD(P)-dependent dehydrogenase (short-subunit alcohol dehydrogenase family)
MGSVEALAGQVVVVTGAGRGIGRALCVGFSNDGATVVGIGHRAETLAQTVDLCPGATTYVCADLSQPAECFRAVQQVIETHGRIDVLINNAGITRAGAFLEVPFETWAEVIALNVLGVAACSRAALPQMIQQGNGRIVTLASRAASVPAPGMSAYGASKAAVSSLTRTLAAEVTAKHPNILINDLIPGPTKTASTATGQDAAAVYPFVRALVTQPAGSPSGTAYFRGEPYDVFRP